MQFILLAAVEVLLTLGSLPLPSSSQQPVQNSKTEWIPPHVSIGAAATRSEQFAAHELARYLGNMTGTAVEIRVLPSGRPLELPTVAVGFDAALSISKLGPTAMASQLEGLRL
eukprot:SAG31_NODE_1802_length_7238_cov_3.417285_1_plen_112_part_10